MSDERITDLILQRLERIEGKLDSIQAQGCSKAESHLRMQANEAELFSRIREVDNSSGASGSGLWWVVFGGIAVDGKLGRTGTVTNGTDELRFVGGILVEPEPLGGL